MDHLESAYLRLVPDAVRYQFGIDVLVNQLRQAAASKSRKAVELIVSAVEAACEGDLDALERAQVHLECGRAFYAIGSRAPAARQVEKSASILTPLARHSNEHRHFLAVALWMQGVLAQEQAPLARKALEYFNGSLAEFEILSLPHQSLWPPAEWYQAAIQEMRQHLNRYWEQTAESASEGRADQPAVSPALPPKPPAGEAPSSNTQILRLPVAGDSPAEPAPASALPAANVAAAARKSAVRMEWVEARLAVSRPRQINIIGRIPAGGFGPDGQLPYRLGGIRIDGEMKSFNLQGIQCRLFSLRAALGVIRLSPARNYFILKVVGDSMDRAGINPGDYVLMVQQDTAEPGDIVAAEVSGVDEGATLKAFARHGRRIVLAPRSSNVNHQEQYFDPASHGFQIRGIVIGVFSPD